MDGDKIQEAPNFRFLEKIQKVESAKSFVVSVAPALFTIHRPEDFLRYVFSRLAVENELVNGTRDLYSLIETSTEVCRPAVCQMPFDKGIEYRWRVEFVPVTAKELIAYIRDPKELSRKLNDEFLACVKNAVR